MKRLYQKQRISKTKTVLTHLNHSGALAFDQITGAVLKGYKVTNKPSLSLMVQAVLIRFAKDMTSAQLSELRAEIQRHGCKPPKAELNKIAQALSIQKEQVNHVAQ